MDISVKLKNMLEVGGCLGAANMGCSSQSNFFTGSSQIQTLTVHVAPHRPSRQVIVTIQMRGQMWSPNTGVLVLPCSPFWIFLIGKGNGRHSTLFFFCLSMHGSCSLTWDMWRDCTGRFSWFSLFSCRQKVCCGIVYKGRFGEVMIDPRLFKPCCRSRQQKPFAPELEDGVSEAYSPVGDLTDVPSSTLGEDQKEIRWSTLCSFPQCLSLCLQWKTSPSVRHTLFCGLQCL